jgi:RNA polymerase sigma-B factor
MIRHLDEAREVLARNNGHGVTPEEIAVYLGVSVERVLELMETQSAAYAASLDSCLAVSEDLKLVKLLGSADSEFDRIEDRDFLDSCLAHLNEVEKQVIQERYMADKSQREVAASLGVSQMYVSRIERKILDKFRNYYEK